MGLDKLLRYNREWAERMTLEKPEIFRSHAKGQRPKYLWIGCADSRVSPYESTGLKIGEIFVHRNIANLVPENDNNSQSVLQFAIEDLKVSHIIVCGHYGCGGVLTAYQGSAKEPVTSWVSGIKTVIDRHQKELALMKTTIEKLNLITKLNVIQQVNNISQNKFFLNSEHKITIDGWVYDLKTGRIGDLEVTKQTGLD
ncbi:MAG: carbonic anhydrase [Deltaproteobacteria bacterium]|nr:carbonic anhydrase [Deltaproteobacteria bacterium]